MRVHRSLFCSFVLLAILGCGGSHRPVRQRVLLPPTLNLMPYHNIGLFQFSVENAKGNLHEFATHRFEEYVLAAQTGIEMREFTSADSSRVFAAASDSNGCPVAFFGHLKISNVKPHGGLTSGLAPVVRDGDRGSVGVAHEHAHRRHHVAQELVVDRRGRRPLLHRRDAFFLRKRSQRRIWPADQRAGVQRDV